MPQAIIIVIVNALKLLILSLLASKYAGEILISSYSVEILLHSDCEGDF